MADRGAYEYVASGSAPDIPSPTSPTLHATGITTSPLFQWDASTPSVAEYYGFELSTASGMSPTVLSETTTATTISTSGLDLLTTYYWQVNAVNSYGTSSWSATQDFQTIIGMPSTPTLSVPADHAVNVTTSPSFSWEAATWASSYNVQLSTYSGFDVSILDTTGITDLTISVSALEYLNTYYWRVSSTNEVGTSGWASRDFVTVIEIADAPTLSLPANHAVNVTTSPNLVWEAAARADSYNVQVSTAGDFESTVVDTTGLSGLTLSVSGLAYLTDYYWRVSATNAGGDSAWSSTWDFQSVIELPGTPLPSAPANHAENVTTSPTFEWTEADRAVTYNLNVSKYSNFNTLTIDQALTTTTYAASGLDHLTSYYWRVNAENNGGSGEWSDTQDLVTIIEEPGLFALSTPTAGSTTSINTRFSWSASARAVHYHLQLATNVGFSTGVINVDNVVERFAVVTLPYDSTYYWRVQAWNVGGTGTWTAGRSFTTESEPAPTSHPTTPNKGFDLITNNEIGDHDNIVVHKDFVNRSLDDIDADITDFALVTISADYSVNPTDEFIMIMANGCTITLPPAASTSIGQYYLIGNNSTITATIDAADLNVNGTSTASLLSGYKLKRAIRTQTEYLVY